MNQIRKSWKDNGTPFYFNFNDGHRRTYLDSFTCSEYDTVQVDDNQHTAMDCLVDIFHVYKSLQRVDDILVKTSVLDALSMVLNNLNYIVSLKKS